MKRIFESALVALGLCLATGSALATTNLPPVKVVGITIDQVKLSCTGAACSSYLESIGGEEPQPIHLRQPNMGEGGMPSVAVTRLQFCNQLASQKPSGCNRASPPSTPVYDPMWEPNGCGTGGLQDLFLSMVMDGLYADHYSGNLDAPMHTSDGVNISFLGACNHHDQCWGSGGARGKCDSAFFDEMRSQCAGLSGADFSSCNGMAGGYYAAVASDYATATYDAWANDLACAAWAYDMRRNGCT
jgi:hypothetical protein